MTREVIDTFRAIGSIQKRYGKKMAHRYIISFTKSAQHVADVFELAHLSFAHEEDVPELDVIPLFEQLEDLEAASTCSTRCLRCPWCKSALPRPTAAWRSCWATPTLPRMPVLPRPCSRCTPHRSVLPSGPRRTISTWCSCTVAAVPWAVAAARPTRPCWRSPRVRSTASLSSPSRVRSSLPVTATARWPSAMLSPLPPQRFCSRPRVSRRPTPRPRRSSGIWRRSLTLQAMSAIWTC